MNYFSLAPFPFYSYTISMLSQRILLPQYRLSPPKAQIPAYFQKVVDIKIVDATITQQLSNSATQQLSNSATQQLSNSATQGVKIVCALIFGQLFFTNSGIFSYTLLQAVFYFLIIGTAGVTCSGIFYTAALQSQHSDTPIITKALYRNVNSARLHTFLIGKMCTVFRQGWQI